MQPVASRFPKQTNHPITSPPETPTHFRLTASTSSLDLSALKSRLTGKSSSSHSPTLPAGPVPNCNLAKSSLRHQQSGPRACAESREVQTTGCRKRRRRSRIPSRDMRPHPSRGPATLAQPTLFRSAGESKVRARGHRLASRGRSRILRSGCGGSATPNTRPCLCIDPGAELPMTLPASNKSRVQDEPSDEAGRTARCDLAAQVLKASRLWAPINTRGRQK